MLKSCVLVLFLSLLNPFPLYADGSYYIGKDAGGVYFQTDRDGGWYIDREDLKFFKIGDTGTYSIGKDPIGTYLSTNKNHKFYLDMKAKSKLVKETEAFNAAQDKRLRNLREDENKRQLTAERREVADKDDKQNPQSVKVEIYVAPGQYDENSRIDNYFGPGFYPSSRLRSHSRTKDRPLPEAPMPISRPGISTHGIGEFPWWKGSLRPRF
jgi:hypothetical protein